MACPLSYPEFRWRGGVLATGVFASALGVHDGRQRGFVGTQVTPKGFQFVVLVGAPVGIPQLDEAYRQRKAVASALMGQGGVCNFGLGKLVGYKRVLPKCRQGGTQGTEQKVLLIQ